MLFFSNNDHLGGNHNGAFVPTIFTDTAYYEDAKVQPGFKYIMGWNEPDNNEPGVSISIDPKSPATVERYVQARLAENSEAEVAKLESDRCSPGQRPVHQGRLAGAGRWNCLVKGTACVIARSGSRQLYRRTSLQTSAPAVLTGVLW